MNTPPQPFSLLACLYPDDEMTDLLGPRVTVQGWLRFEQALAAAQSEVGILDGSDAEAIGKLRVDQVDLEALWLSARNVGYPILPLVRQMAALLPEGPDGRVHFGATTQDVMDTGLALQVRDACDLLLRRIGSVGDRLAVLVADHAETVMPGRTHGQQAVPTTFGAQLAPLLAETARSRGRLVAARREVAVLSLFGAGGTSAALGSRASELRELMAQSLGLEATDVPWHTSRDNLAHVAQVCVLITGGCARLARNVIDLSRTEIAELHEVAGAHRGASSTMPQKANPILAEGIVGMAAIVGPLVAALSRALEVPQERAAGEWQVEWHVLPQVLQLTSNVLSAADELLAGLRVEVEAMRANLDRDGGLIMSEAAMIALAESLGREAAHDIVYAAARDVRATGALLPDAIEKQLAEAGHAAAAVAVPPPEDYLGDVRIACEAARRQWSNFNMPETESHL